MKNLFLSVVLFAFALSPALSDTTDSLSTKDIEVNAIRLSETVTVDGILSESVWHNGCCVSEFTQREPDEWAEATEKTEVRVAYDDDALYVGARMYDSAPDSIIARLGRRDEWPSERSGDRCWAPKHCS